MAFRYISGNHHPDHDTIAAFRKRFLKELEGLFVQILLVCQQMGFGRVGQVNIDLQSAMENRIEVYYFIFIEIYASNSPAMLSNTRTI